MAPDGGASRQADLSTFRLDKARQLGFNAHPADEQLPSEYDVLLECSGSAAALATGMQSVARAGRVVLVGMGADTVAINVSLLQGREINLTGTFRYANTYPLALQLLASGAVDVDSVITHHFGIDETQAALTLSKSDPQSLKAIVLPQAPRMEPTTPSAADRERSNRTAEKYSARAPAHPCRPGRVAGRHCDRQWTGSSLRNEASPSSSVLAHLAAARRVGDWVSAGRL